MSSDTIVVDIPYQGPFNREKYKNIHNCYIASCLKRMGYVGVWVTPVSVHIGLVRYLPDISIDVDMFEYQFDTLKCGFTVVLSKCG